jgi:hypothetical protein
LFFAPGERQPCFVCGKFKSITQTHHVIPLTAQYDRGFEYPDDEHEWLCPSHHIMAHLFIPSDDRSYEPSALRRSGATLAAIHPDLSEAEFEKMLELMRRSARSPL